MSLLELDVPLAAVFVLLSGYKGSEVDLARTLLLML